MIFVVVCYYQTKYELYGLEDRVQELSKTHTNNLAYRGKRDTSNYTIPACRKKKRTHSNNKRSVGAHFYAYVDDTKLFRQEAGGLDTVGTFTRNGFVPKDQLYRVWKAEDWVDDQLFGYENGKVTVKQAGTYLLYAQVLFHGPSVRKSFGLHVNDELVPFVEAASFEILPGRKKRSIAPSTYREKRSTHNYYPYNQCNTQAVTFLKRNDKVFVRSIEKGRSIIVMRPLTFFGLVRL